MYRIWVKKIKNNKIIASINIKNNENIDLTEKRNKCLAEACQKFDLSVPILLKKHEEDFSQFKYMVFYPDDFIDEIDFDKLEFELIDDETSKK
ncbi:MAG: hypothetical protein PHT02_02365 [Tissierellia bacterium]|nr:hypothetical protein [Tissierellia bacterium]